MPRRKDFRGVAFGLLGTFVSRNNDVGGYWALGKLYKHARVSKAYEVHVDLVRSAIVPPNPEFSDMVRHFRQMLTDQLVARRLPEEWLREADVRVTFFESKSVDRPGDVFECLVTLTDDLGGTHKAQENGACWIHDSAKECKSTRV